MAKPPSSEFQTVVKRLLSTPPKPHADSKLGKGKPGAAAKPARRTAGKGRVRVGKAKG